LNENRGALKIAEVSSRFTDLDEFIASVESIGFKLDYRDDSNKMFVMLEFTKAFESPTKPKSKPSSKDEKLDSVKLKPCVYKKR
jgi:ribosomal RNA-processing protein 8